MEPPAFLQPLKPQAALDGEEVTFTLIVTGKPQPQLSWFHNDKNIDNSEEFVISYDEDSGTCRMVIVECFPEDAGVFKCVASNPIGEATTTAELTVNVPSEIVSEAEPPLDEFTSADERDQAFFPVMHQPPEHVEKVANEMAETIVEEVKQEAPRRESLDKKPRTEEVAPVVPESLIEPAMDSPAELEPHTVPDEAAPAELEPHTVPDEAAPAELETHTVPDEAAPTELEPQTAPARDEVVKMETETLVIGPREMEPPSEIQMTVVQQGDSTDAPAAAQITMMVPGEELREVKPMEAVEPVQDLPQVQSTAPQPMEVTWSEAPRESVDSTVQQETEPQKQTSEIMFNVVSDKPKEAAPGEMVISLAPDVGTSSTFTILPSKHETIETKTEREVVTKVTEVTTQEEPAQFLEPIKPQVVREGENGMFTTIVTGAPQPDVIWYKDNTPLEPGDKYNMDFQPQSGTATLTIKNAVPEDLGNFTCQAKNPAGRAKCTANLVVVRKYPPHTE